MRRNWPAISSVFVLSDAGQRLLLQPGVGRVPAGLGPGRGGRGDPEPMRNAIRRAWQTYDAGLAEQRYWAVNALFDIFISDRPPQRRELWARAARVRAPGDELARVERLLTTLPVDEAEALSPTSTAAPLHHRPDRDDAGAEGCA